MSRVTCSCSYLFPRAESWAWATSLSFAFTHAGAYRPSIHSAFPVTLCLRSGTLGFVCRYHNPQSDLENLTNTLNNQEIEKCMFLTTRMIYIKHAIDWESWWYLTSSVVPPLGRSRKVLLPELFICLWIAWIDCNIHVSHSLPISHQPPSMTTGIWYIPKAVALKDDLFHTDEYEEHLNCPLRPWEDKSTDEER
jgi:hypothetical protein